MVAVALPLAPFHGSRTGNAAGVGCVAFGPSLDFLLSEDSQESELTVLVGR